MSQSARDHPREPDGPGSPGHAEAHVLAPRLNWLRAGVLGANDGIVSTAGLVIGVAGAAAPRGVVFTAGLAGLVAGAVSMGLGEYVSVSSQRDSERSQLALEAREIDEDPEAELDELAAIYRSKGLTASTATLVATELTAHDALRAHADAELRIDPDELTNPVHASIASAIAFTLGALLPLVAILATPTWSRVPATAAVAVAALGVTGAVSARLGGARMRGAVLRLVIGGAAGLGLTYSIGRLFGSAIG